MFTPAARSPGLSRAPLPRNGKSTWLTVTTSAVSWAWIRWDRPTDGGDGGGVDPPRVEGLEEPEPPQEASIALSKINASAAIPCLLRPVIPRNLLSARTYDCM